jgi:hypothetical protein
MNLSVSIMANVSWFNNYHPYAEHLTFLSELQTQFPSNARVVTSGTSLQGRAITGIQLYGSSGGGARPGIIFHGTVHAREWITTMVSRIEYLITIELRCLLMWLFRRLNISPGLYFQAMRQTQRSRASLTSTISTCSPSLILMVSHKMEHGVSDLINDTM